ncbi:hypothetical protein [Simkania sp.]|uniref:hypothetical protein n=1 Tax=Simkania sp. TaxID=34094 RepID=UPI003B527153
MKLAEKPADKDAAEKLDPAVVRYAFNHYAVFTKDMDKDTKAALDAKIIEAHAKKPEKEEDAGKMTPAQLTFIYANLDSYTKDMDAKIVTALEEAILKAGVIKAEKPANKDDAAKVEGLQLRALNAQHETIFGADPKWADVEVITALNTEYKKAGLAEQKVPTKPMGPPPPPAKSTTDKIVDCGKAVFGAIVGHPKTTMATLAYAVTYGVESYMGWDVPYIPGI